MSRIAIIGAGPIGLAMAKAIGLEPNAESTFSSIDVYERHPVSGGLWYYTGVKEHLVACVPATNQAEASEKLNKEESELSVKERFVSAMYKELETNIVKDLMKYKDCPFPSECETFPSRSEVLAYLQSYSKTISDQVKFKYNSNVLSLTKKNGEWEIIYEDVSDNNKVITSFYDYVVLAQGHFDLPFIPDVDGLKEWDQKAPGSISHAKYYNAADDFKGKKVLIIGNGASGIDIATQLSTTASSVIVSSSSASTVADINIDGVEEIDKILKYNFDDNKSVSTETGKTINGIDTVIFCTGYLYTLPFLKSYMDGEQAVVTDGSQIRYLYKQIFYIPDPTLIHGGLPKFIIPFPFAECQAQYVARIVSGRMKLPSTEEMLEEYREELSTKGEGKTFHDLKPPADSGYCNMLCDLVSDKSDDGFTAEYWDDYKKDLRARTAALKAARLEMIVKHAQNLKSSEKPFALLRGPTD